MASSSQRSCRHVNLVTSETCKVELCSHGTVHLVLGDLTLRLRRDDLLDLAGALAQASAHLTEPRLHS